MNETFEKTSGITVDDLLNFIEKTPNAWVAAERMAQGLRAAGYRELHESERWDLDIGGKYMVRRNGSSLIAFSIPSYEFDGYRIAAAHLDSPAFKLKPSPDRNGEYKLLATERYGGMNHSTWIDRPLSVAGRVVVRTENGIESRAVDLGRPIAVFPSVAIHLQRNVNDGVALNPAVDFLGLYGIGKDGSGILDAVAKAVGVEKDGILSHDLAFYNCERGVVFGQNSEFVAAPRLDDLECAYAAYTALLSAESADSVPVLALFDNEEVGSATRQGADSDFLVSVLRRISDCTGGNESDYLCRLSDSFMLSEDNAHAKHPNHKELSDATDAPIPNAGIVLKYNASQRYATDAISAAIFTEICKKAGVPVQVYTNRADLPGGSTLGNISSGHVSIPTADIGLCQFAMHSAYETAGVQDFLYLVRATAAFFGSNFHILRDGKYEM